MSSIKLSHGSDSAPEPSTSTEDHVSTKTDPAGGDKTGGILAILESAGEGAENLGAVPDFLNAKWDPDDLTDTEVTTPPSPACIRRIKK